MDAESPPGSPGHVPLNSERQEYDSTYGKYMTGLPNLCPGHYSVLLKQGHTSVWSGSPCLSDLISASSIVCVLHVQSS